MTRGRLLSQAEFARASALARNMEPATLAIAHAVLVAGKKQVDVARETGVTPAWVSEAVAKVRRLVEDAERLTVPKGWMTDTVSLPPDLWPEVRRIEREARARLKTGPGN